MADIDSNTLDSSGVDTRISELFRLPHSITMDLFQVLDTCHDYVSTLIESKCLVEKIALCGRLFTALINLKELLNLPLPPHLIDSLTEGLDVLTTLNTLHRRFQYFT